MITSVSSIIEQGGHMTELKRFSDYQYAEIDIDVLLDEITLLFEVEDSGFITNTISMSLTRRMRNVGKQVKRTKNVDRKIDLISEQLSYLMGVVLISVLVSGSKGGLFTRGSKLIGIIKAIGKG